MTDLSKLVKPLEWRQVEPHIYAAETSAHAYVIFDFDAGPILTRDSVRVASGAMPDLKTFAQADYTDRIIAALDPEALAKIRTDALREAADLVDDFRRAPATAGLGCDPMIEAILALINKEDQA